MKEVSQLIKLEEFHHNFIQDIFATADSRALGYKKAFFENVCDELIATGELPEDVHDAYYQYLKGRFPMEVSGFSYDEEREILYVITSTFFQDDRQIETISSKTIEQMLKRARNFISKSTDTFYLELEETSNEFEMAHFIYDKCYQNKISRIKVILISDGRISRAYKPLILDPLKKIPIDTLVVDIEYLFGNFNAQNADSAFSVDINLPALIVPTGTEKYISYLSYLSGEQIFDIYEEFGKRLLEQNVRTFLQFRGGVNKGIRNTINGAPEMFFAYNNGITATASAVDLNDKNEIIKIHNLQIVNGGQTTSSIYAAKKTHKADISNVSVQIKLSVINDLDKHSDFVSRVAEYANTQNKVNKSDFFSNSPFHKEFKTYSKSTWVPTNTQERHKWFYERVRGEYLNEQAYETKTEKDKFELMFPRSKKIEKTFLAKSEMAWLQKPHIVSQGAQNSFISFADYINDKIEKDNLSITEKYYKDAVSRIIIFQNLEKLVSASDWYDGGFRANIVAYTISYFSYAVSKTKKYFNFEKVWETQSIPQDLYKEFESLTEEIFSFIVPPPKGHGNPAQWSKKEACWKRIQENQLNFNIPSHYLLDNTDQQIIKKEEKILKKQDNSIEIEKFIISVDFTEWIKLFNYFSEESNLRSIGITKLGILKSMAHGKIPYPSEAQCKSLYEIYQVAKKEGLIL